jgi:quercetin dioxygenase-like cupin family protein
VTDPQGNDPHWIIDGYEQWLAAEGVPVVGGLAVDLMRAETRLWPRIGVPATFVHLDARGDFCSMFVAEIPAGGGTEPIHHLAEAIVYVLDGRGSTTLDIGGVHRAFEWGKGSLFAIPPNATYRHLNASGRDSARLVHVTNLPMLLKLFRDQQFVFGSDHAFLDRLGGADAYAGKGTFVEIREHRHQWETNLVPDLLTFDQMRLSEGRGRGSSNIMFILGEGTLHSHMSEIPPAGYKKAHHHDEGYHIFQLSGDGYSFYWNEGEARRRVDWTYGLAHAPSRGMWHQHYNVSDEPARYLAIAFGSQRYPFLRSKVEILKRDYKKPGAFQIEYGDEDPEIRRTFDHERELFRTRTPAVPG